MWGMEALSKVLHYPKLVYRKYGHYSMAVSPELENKVFACGVCANMHFYCQPTNDWTFLDTSRLIYTRLPRSKPIKSKQSRPKPIKSKQRTPSSCLPTNQWLDFSLIQANWFTRGCLNLNQLNLSCHSTPSYSDLRIHRKLEVGVCRGASIQANWISAITELVSQLGFSSLRARVIS